MNAIRLFAVLGLVVGLGGCVEGGAGTGMPGRDAQAGRVGAQYDVTDIKISVPQTLKVSEANSYHPSADIVWRGDPAGDRYAQVQSIMEEGFAKGTAGMTKGQKVVVEAEVTRFHCLTEKARYVIGGTHSVKFILTVRDAKSGQIIDGPRLVKADVQAAGGEKAMAEDRAGRTQRVVIVEDLIAVMQRELATQPVAVSQ